MKKIKIVFLIVIVFLFFVPFFAAAESEDTAGIEGTVETQGVPESKDNAESERNIYIGDLIELKITSGTITEDELREKFEEFDIVDIKSDGESYIITIRSFEPGEKIVKVGNKEIVIDIKSTLDEIDNEGIFEGSFEPKTGGKFNIAGYAAFLFPCVFFLCGIMLLVTFIKRKKAASLIPYQLFVKNTGALSPNDAAYLVKLTECFKKYIEDVYSYSIRGKTSSEIIGEIKNIKEIDPFIKNLKEWLYECDIFKFSGKTPAPEDKKRLFESLMGIVGKIEKTKEGEV
ncbi:hypothetical protein [Acetivibrio saccincola]|mgnify:CR=1 FL=1|jgi:hypothetical protein|uniref:DUF4129 domain-containing protein n=1 Tax=Acetivibrio saccincola TaxID=1677857 RepID=A0A2K9EAJ2_9FIRM|nr:hypothetical protein [Acetivibrio saccincola]AUG58726.1 hypothetical protein HVS_14325 [Acetivibrio saccincola]NLW27704.1 hypothetical protein [Acetivibrio saccincola]PQQ66173.1 hypothetical protein B9R14_05005 [Acetivibrio saccincola]HQD28665.1 hypothetical protein [Acetivibrio saccincola]